MEACAPNPETEVVCEYLEKVDYFLNFTRQQSNDTRVKGVVFKGKQFENGEKEGGVEPVRGRA